MAADLFTKYNCTNCQEDISGIRVHCAVCSTSYDSCLQCFSAGAEIGEHKNDHSYQFMDTGTSILSIFRGKTAWSAREELRLLDAIEQYGFGNWEDISKHIETRSAEDSKEEYVNKYLLGAIGRNTWNPAQLQRPKLVDHNADDDQGPLASEIIRRLPPLDVLPEEAAQLGYMPNRDGFEREYDPTAETLVSALTLPSDDIETDLMLKLAQVDIYTRRLRERARRKRIVRDYQLIANFFRQKNVLPPLPRITKEQRDFRDRFRVFAQFYTAQEYERLMNSVERERELRLRLSELNRYRWNGLTRIDECIHFEQHAAAAASQQRNTGPYGHGRTDNQILKQESCSQSQHSTTNKKTENGNGQKNSNFTGQNPMHHTGDQIYYEGSSHNKNYSDEIQVMSGQSNIQSPAMTPTQKWTNQQQPQNQMLNVNTAVEAGESQYQQLPQNQPHLSPSQMSQTLQNQLEIQNLPQVGEILLSKNEIQLCTSLNLPPTRYISLKTILLSGSNSTSSPLESNVKKFLIKTGWLSN